MVTPEQMLKQLREEFATQNEGSLPEPPPVMPELPPPAERQVPDALPAPPPELVAPPTIVDGINFDALKAEFPTPDDTGAPVPAPPPEVGVPEQIMAGAQGLVSGATLGNDQTAFGGAVPLPPRAEGTDLAFFVGENIGLAAPFGIASKAVHGLIQPVLKAGSQIVKMPMTIPRAVITEAVTFAGVEALRAGTVEDRAQRAVIGATIGGVLGGTFAAVGKFLKGKPDLNMGTIDDAIEVVRQRLGSKLVQDFPTLKGDTVAELTKELVRRTGRGGDEIAEVAAALEPIVNSKTRTSFEVVEATYDLLMQKADEGIKKVKTDVKEVAVPKPVATGKPMKDTDILTPEQQELAQELDDDIEKQFKKTHRAARRARERVKQREKDIAAAEELPGSDMVEIPTPPAELPVVPREVVPEKPPVIQALEKEFAPSPTELPPAPKVPQVAPIGDTRGVLTPKAVVPAVGKKITKTVEALPEPPDARMEAHDLANELNRLSGYRELGIPYSKLGRVPTQEEVDVAETAWKASKAKVKALTPEESERVFGKEKLPEPPALEPEVMPEPPPSASPEEYPLYETPPELMPEVTGDLGTGEGVTRPAQLALPEPSLPPDIELVTKLKDMANGKEVKISDEAMAHLANTLETDIEGAHDFVSDLKIQATKREMLLPDSPRLTRDMIASPPEFEPPDPMRTSEKIVRSYSKGDRVDVEGRPGIITNIEMDNGLKFRVKLDTGESILAPKEVMTPGAEIDAAQLMAERLRQERPSVKAKKASEDLVQEITPATDDVDANFSSDEIADAATFSEAEMVESAVELIPESRPRVMSAPEFEVAPPAKLPIPALEELVGDIPSSRIGLHKTKMPVPPEGYALLFRVGKPKVYVDSGRKARGTTMTTDFDTAKEYFDRGGGKQSIYMTILPQEYIDSFQVSRLNAKKLEKSGVGLPLDDYVNPDKEYFIPFHNDLQVLPMTKDKGGMYYPKTPFQAPGEPVTEKVVKAITEEKVVRKARARHYVMPDEADVILQAVATGRGSIEDSPGIRIQALGKLYDRAYIENNLDPSGKTGRVLLSKYIAKKLFRPAGEGKVQFSSLYFDLESGRAITQDSDPELVARFLEAFGVGRSGGVASPEDEVLRRLRGRLVEKSPERLANDGEYATAAKVQENNDKRAKYLNDAVESMTEDEVKAAAAKGGAPIGSSPWDVEIPNFDPKDTDLAYGTFRKQRGMVSQVTPLRNVFGVEMNGRVEKIHVETQEALRKVQSVVLKTLLDNDAIPSMGIWKKRPTLHKANYDSLDTITRSMLGVPTRRPATPMEQKVGQELKPLFIKLIGHVDGNPLTWLTNHQRSKPMDVPTFFSALARRAINDEYTRPGLSYVEGMMDKQAVGTSTLKIWGKWKNMILGQPLDSEIQMSQTIKNVMSKMEGVPGIGHNFANISDRSALELSQAVTDWFYLGGLGARPRSVLMNLTQNNLTLAEIGFKYTAVGAKRFLTNWKSELKRLREYGVLTAPAEALEAEVRQFMGETRRESMMRVLMAAFRWADIFNRATAFLGGEAKFLNFAQRGQAKALIDGTKWLTTGARQDLRPSLHALVDMGHIERAARLYGKDVANNTQFVYGRANTPIMLQSPLGKILGQFTQYPLNYAVFWRSMFEKGRRNMIMTHIATSFAATWGMAKFFDVDITTWIGAGSMPEELGVTGPAGRMVLNLAQGSIAAAKLATMPEDLQDTYNAEFANARLKDAAKEFARSSVIAVPGGAAARDIYKGLQKGGLSTAARDYFLPPAARRREPKAGGFGKLPGASKEPKLPNLP